MADGIRIARLIYQIYFTLLAVTLLTLTIVSFMKYDEASIFYDLIIENWQTDPLVDVRLTFESCTQLEDSLTQYFWPGTMDGCDCRDVQRRLFEHRILGVKKIIYNDHLCNSTQEDAGCKSIHGKQSFSLNYFPDPTGKTGIQLCGKRDTKNSFYNVGTNLKGCTSAQKMCGNQLNFLYCVDKQQKCPITSFLFTNQTIEDQESIELPFDQYLIIGRLEPKLPLVQFRVAEGDGVCMNNHQKSITRGRADYPLMNSVKIECENDPRFNQLYKTYEQDFYNVNDRANLSTELRGYEISNNYQWGFYARNYIPWNQECRGDVMQEFKDLGGILDVIWDQEKDLLIIGIIFFVFMGFLFPIISLIICCDCCCEGESTLACILYIEIGFKIILQVAFTVITVISYTTTNGVIKYFDKIIIQKCSDEITQREFSDFRTLLQNNVFNFNIGYLVLFIITTILDCCFLMAISAKYFCKAIKRNRYNPGVQKQNSRVNFEMPQAPKIENNYNEDINHPNVNIFRIRLWINLYL